MSLIKGVKNKFEIKDLKRGEVIKKRDLEIEKGVVLEEIEKGEKAPSERKADEQFLEEGSGGFESAGIIAVQNARQELKEREQKIEKILEENIAEIFLAMPPNKQAEFKVAGEKAAREINKLLGGTKIKLKKIIDLIKKWLALLPGINRFFLEQESKIKADKILEMRREHE
jgi:hypothetical protein